MKAAFSLERITGGVQGRRAMERPTSNSGNEFRSTAKMLMID